MCFISTHDVHACRHPAEPPGAGASARPLSVCWQCRVHDTMTSLTGILLSHMRLEALQAWLSPIWHQPYDAACEDCECC